MQNIFEVYQLLQFITDTAINGVVTPDEASRALSTGQQKVYDKYAYSLPSDTSTDALAPFFPPPVTISANSVGVATYPADFAHLKGLFTSDGREIKIVLVSELQYALQSQLYPIAEYPRCLKISTGVQVIPQVAQNVTLYYYRRPIDCKIGITVTGNAVTYDPTTSIQLEFNSNYWREILYACLPEVGVNLQDKEVAALITQFNPQNGN